MRKVKGKERKYIWWFRGLVEFFPSLVVRSKLFQKENVSSIPFWPDPPRGDLGFFPSRN